MGMLFDILILYDLQQKLNVSMLKKFSYEIWSFQNKG